MYKSLFELVNVYEAEGTRGELVRVDSNVVLGGNKLGAIALEDLLSYEYLENGEVCSIVDIFDALLNCVEINVEVDSGEVVDLGVIERGESTLGEFDFTVFEMYASRKDSFDQVKSIERYLLENNIGEVVFIEED